MKMKRILIAAACLLPLVAVVALFVAARLSRTPVEVGLSAGRLRPCPPKPNCVCSEERSLTSSLEPLRFQGNPSTAFRNLLDLVAADAGAEVRTREAGYAHVVYLTPFFGFADDIELRLDTEANAIHLRSASRVGYSDLGANRKRMEALRGRWETRREEG